MNENVTAAPTNTEDPPANVAPESAPKRTRKVTELKAIELILKNLEELPNDGAVKRVLNYVVDHVQAQFEEKAAETPSPQDERNVQMLQNLYAHRQ